jgi:Cu/Ag efflux protein CusF
MSKKAFGFAIAAAALALSAPAFAQSPPQTSGRGSWKGRSGGMSDAVMVTATVQAVDVKARTVTLKGPEGKVVTIKVDPSIPNLEKLKVGDEVVAKYYEALAWEVKKAGTSTMQPGVTESAGAGKESHGRTAIGHRSVRMVVTITAIDTTAHTVTVKEPDGPTTVIKVKNPANLEGVKVGDEVEVKFSQALAVSLEPAPKK